MPQLQKESKRETFHMKKWVLYAVLFEWFLAPKLALKQRHTQLFIDRGPKENTRGQSKLQYRWNKKLKELKFEIGFIFLRFENCWKTPFTPVFINGQTKQQVNNTELFSPTLKTKKVKINKRESKEKFDKDVQVSQMIVGVNLGVYVC